MSLRTQLSGTGVAIITPFLKNLSVDYIGLEKTINHVINGGVNYIVVLGTTGETPTLSKEEKIDILHATYQYVNSRVPIVVGIGGNDTSGIIKDLQQFPIDKSVAILSASPYYSKPSQTGLYQHYKAIAEASSKPILLYNVPGRTGRNLEAKTTIQLAHDIENIVGIKEATDDMNQCMQILKNKPTDFLVVSGDDALALSQIACGMDGIISVVANTLPKQFSTIIQLCLQGNFEVARGLHYQLLDGYSLLFEENNPAGVKAFMHEQGLIENVVRLPVTPVSDVLHSKINQFLSSL